MKRGVLNVKVFNALNNRLAILIAFVFIGLLVNGQNSPVTGDYRNTATTTSFNTSIFWQTYNGSTWVSAVAGPLGPANTSTLAKGTANLTSGQSSITVTPTTVNGGSTPLIAVGQVVTGTNIPAGTKVSTYNSSTGAMTLSNNASATASNVTLSFSWGVQQATTATGLPNGTTGNSITITLAAPNNSIVVGQIVTGTGITGYATVTGGVGTTSITATLTGSSTQNSSATTLTFSQPNVVGSTTSGTNTITLNTTNGIVAVGQTVSGTGVPGGTTVTAVTTINSGLQTQVTLSYNATSTNSNTAYTFGYLNIPNLYVNWSVASATANCLSTIGNVWVNFSSNGTSGTYTGSGSGSGLYQNNTAVSLGIGTATGAAYVSNFICQTLNIASGSTVVNVANASITSTNSMYLLGGGSGNVISNSGTINLGANGGNTTTSLYFNNSSSSAITATVTGTSGTYTLSAVTLNSVAASTVSLGSGISSFTLTSLNLTSGILSLGSNSITPSSISGSPWSRNNYINAGGTGTLTLNSVSASATTFPIGTSSYYLPLVFTSTTNTPNITVGVSTTFTNTLYAPNNIVNAQWSILASTASQSKIAFQYNTANTGSGYTNNSSIVLGAYVSGAYAETVFGSAATGSNPYVATLPNNTYSLQTGSAGLYGIGNPSSFSSAAPITFNSITKFVGDANFSLSASSSSSGAYTYTSGTTSVATISGSTVTILGAGTSTITVNQAASGQYAAGSTTATLTVVPVYTWNGTTSDYQVSTNWTPTRTTPGVTDVLQFNANATVTNVPTQTIGRLVLSNNASVSLQETSGTSATLTVGNTAVHAAGVGDEISVPSGCTLTLAQNASGGAEIFTLTLNSAVTGVTAGIYGTLTIAQNTSSTYNNVYNAANGVTTVYSTGVINYAGSVGSSTATSLVFKNGSTIINQRADANFGFSSSYGTTSTDRVNVTFSGSNCGTSSTGQIPISNFPAYIGTLTINATGATGTMNVRAVSGGNGTTQTVDITTLTVSSTGTGSFGFGSNTTAVSTVNVGTGGITVNGGKLNLAYNIGQNITVSGDLNISNSGAVFVCGSGANSTYTANLTVNNLTLTGTSSFTLNSAGGTGSAQTNNPISSLTIKNNLSVASGCTFQNSQYAPSSSSTIIMNGSVAQSITASGTFNYLGSTTLQINSQAGSSPNNIISLSGTMPTIGTLQLTSGVLSLGSTNLTTGAISGGSSSSYVNASGSGLLTFTSVPTTSTLFPVGTSSSYAPLTFSGGTAGANVTVGVKGTFTNSVLQPSQVVNLQWSILASASTAPTITFQYNTADGASNITQSTAILGTYAGGSYSESVSAVTTVSSSNPYSVSYSFPANLPTVTASLYGIGNPNAFVAGVPYAPTIGTATLNGNNTSATVTFTAPSNAVSTGVTSYTVTSSPNDITATASGSPITVNGLGGGTSYTFTVVATNANGNSPASSASNSVTTATDTYTWSGATSSDYQDATNWTPNRTTPEATDIIQFTSSATVINVPTQSIGRLVLSSSASVSLQSVSGAGASTLTVGNASVHTNGIDDISVPSGCTLTMAGNTSGTKTDYLVLALANVTGVTSNIAGTLTIQPNSSITSSGTSGYANSTTYSLNQLITYNGNVYTVTTAGTTAASGGAPGVSSGTATSGTVTFTYYGTLFGSNYAVSYSNTYNASYGVTTISGTVNYAGAISGITSTSLSFTNTSTFNNQRADATFPSSATSTTYNRVNVSITGVTNSAGQVPVSYLPSSINTLTINDAGVTGSSFLLIRSVSGGGSGTTQTADITNLTVTNGICGFGVNATGISTVTVGTGGVNVSGGKLYLAYNNAETINVSGDITLSGGVLAMCSSGGSAFAATMNAVNFNQTGTSTFYLNGYFGSSPYPTATLNLTGNLSVGTGSTFSQASTPTGNLVMKSTSSAQTISNTGSFYSITTLQINNTNSSPNNTVTLNNPLSFGSLTLTAGLLNTSSATLTLTNTATTAISGGSASSYVSGPLSWTLPSSLASGSTYNFPIGSSSTYLPFSLVNPTTGTGSVTAKVQAFSTTSGGSVDGTTVYAKSTSEYWYLQTSGNFTNTQVSITRQTAITPFNVIGASSTQAGPYNSLAGTVGTYGVTASTATSTAHYFVLAEAFITPTITVNVGTYSYSGSGQGPTTVTGNTGNGTVTWSYVGTGSTSYPASATLPTNVGTYTATATVAASGVYAVATSSATAFSISATVPTAPVSVSAADDNAQAEITYSAPTNNGGVAIIDYTITAVPASGSPIVKTGITSSPYTFTGLTNGIAYTFTVAARNSVGTGATTTSNQITPSSTTTWNGTSWSATAPDASQSGIIAANLDNSNPAATFSTVANLTINAGVTFNMNSNVTVNGAFVNNGTIIGTGILILAGGSAQSISGTGIVNNITINNSNGVQIASGSNSLGITGILTLQSGTLTTNGKLTLKSSSLANTGVLAPYVASGNTGTIIGNVTVERYIPKGFRAYRDIAPEVYGAGTIFKNWQLNGATTPGYGIFITGPTAYAGSSNAGSNDANGFDESGTSTYNTQDYTFVNGVWKALLNTNLTNLDAFTGYRLLVRGDRTSNMYTSPVINTQSGLSMFNATTLSATGKLITGTVTYNTVTNGGVVNTATGGNTSVGLNATTNGFSLVANPYVAPVQWGTGTGSNSATTTVYGASVGINGSYWYLDPTSGATGKYIAFNALTLSTH